MGVVWSARDEQTGDVCAVKLLRFVDASAVRRFARERDVLTALAHPNIVRIVDAWDPSATAHVARNGLAYVAMQLLEGETLEARLQREQRLAPACMVALARVLLRALSYAHGCGIVHRDLKPQNVFMHRTAEGEEAKVIDFGLAKSTAVWDAKSTTLTRTGTRIGTPRYMAPEQIFDDPNADHRVDLWALGILMYRAISGVFPIDGRSLGEIVRGFAQQRAIPLLRRCPELDSRLASFVDALLQQDPDQRPANAPAALALLASVRFGELTSMSASQ
jgi:eukaryotic-like serine/threonine-protein kinase